jgi:ribosome-binding protein aMBF1 (putative translation factor)
VLPFLAGVIAEISVRNCDEPRRVEDLPPPQAPRRGVEESPECDRLYEEAALAHDLGQLVHDRGIALGLSQTELAERCGEAAAS